MASQSVDISGTTDSGSAHTHGWGTYRIQGSVSNIHAHYRTISNNANLNTTGAMAQSWTDNTYACTDTSTTKEHQVYSLTFDTNNGGTSGSSGSESSHTHTFSSSATVGSGNYTRPNSRAVLFCIRY